MNSWIFSILIENITPVSYTNISAKTSSVFDSFFQHEFWGYRNTYGITIILAATLGQIWANEIFKVLSGFFLSGPKKKYQINDFSLVLFLLIKAIVFALLHINISFIFYKYSKDLFFKIFNFLLFIFGCMLLTLNVLFFIYILLCEYTYIEYNAGLYFVFAGIAVIVGPIIAIKLDDKLKK